MKLPLWTLALFACSFGCSSAEQASPNAPDASLVDSSVARDAPSEGESSSAQTKAGYTSDQMIYGETLVFIHVRGSGWDLS